MGEITQEPLSYSKQNLTLTYVLKAAKKGKVHLFESMAQDWPFIPCIPSSHSWYLIVPTVLYRCREQKMHEWLKNNLKLFQYLDKNNNATCGTIHSILDKIGVFKKRDLRACIMTLNEYPELAERIFDTDYYFCEEFLHWELLKKPLAHLSDNPLISTRSQMKILSDLLVDGHTEPSSPIDLVMKVTYEKAFKDQIKKFYKDFMKTALSIGIKYESAHKHFKSTICLKFFYSNCINGFNWFITKYPGDLSLPVVSQATFKFNHQDSNLTYNFFEYWRKYLTKMIPTDCMLMKLLSTWCPLETFKQIVPNLVNEELQTFFWDGVWLFACKHAPDLLWYVLQETECFTHDVIFFNLGNEYETLMKLFSDVEMKKKVLYVLFAINKMQRKCVFSYQTKSEYLIHLMAIGDVEVVIGQALLPHFPENALCYFQSHKKIIQSSRLEAVLPWLDKSLNFWDHTVVEQNHQTWSILKKNGLTFSANESAWDHCSTKGDLIWLFVNHLSHDNISSVVTIIQKMDQLDAFEEGLRFLQTSKIERTEAEIEMFVKNAHKHLSKFNIERLTLALKPKKRAFSQN